MKTLWIITGEASGDDYGAGLARAVMAMAPDIAVKGMGAEKMRAAGVDIMVDSTDLGIVGFVEVFKHIAFFIRLMKDLIRRARAERPDAVVLIDYPGFNIRLAKRLKALGIPVVYYISPQVWAWKKRRIYTLADVAEKMLCIFPFEPECYAKTRLEAIFVGHPLLQTLSPLTAQPAQREPNLVILLPGSRKSEYTRLMPAFIDTALRLHQRNPELKFHLPMRNQQNIQAVKDIIRRIRPDFDGALFEFSAGDARQWMRRGAAGIAASGTVTVEATILGLPLVVTYKLNPLTFWLARKIVKLPSITIANLVTRKTVFQEFLQEDATADNLADALEAILPGGARRQEVLAGMAECVGKLGEGQDVAANVAENVLQTIRK